MESDLRYQFNLDGAPLRLDYSHAAQPPAAASASATSDWICPGCSAVNFSRCVRVHWPLPLGLIASLYSCVSSLRAVPGKHWILHVKCPDVFCCHLRQPTTSVQLACSIWSSPGWQLVLLIRLCQQAELHLQPSTPCCLARLHGLRGYAARTHGKQAWECRLHLHAG